MLLFNLLVPVVFALTAVGTYDKIIKEASVVKPVAKSILGNNVVVVYV